MTFDLEARVRRLEDRVLISDRVVSYAVAVDQRDWVLFAGCFADPMHADYSENGLAAADFARDDLVDIVRSAVSGYTATQHLSANHLIDFDPDDPDRATCHSSMYAQHHLADGEELLILRGWYANHLARVANGWKIDRIVQHVSWREVSRPRPTVSTDERTTI